MDSAMPLYLNKDCPFCSKSQKKKIIVFSTENKKKIQDQTENGCSMLRIKKTNTQNLYYYVLLRP